MIVLGCDPHKKSHTIVAMDLLGKVISRITIPNTFKGFDELIVWANEIDPERIWGVENSQHYAIHLAQYLIDQNEEAYEITPKLTAQLRGRSLKSGKSDKNDAIAIAKAVIQERKYLHKVSSNKTIYAHLKELTRFRDAIVKKRTDFVNQIHKALYRLDLEYQEIVKNPATQKGMKLIEKEYLESEEYTNQMQIILKNEIRILLNQICTLNESIKDLENQIKPMVEEIDSPLSSVDGIGEITLPTLIGEIGEIKEYKNSAELASRAGISPIENSSARNNYKRVNPGGNRRLNAAIHRIALYQIRKNELASTYYLKKQSEGKTKKEAIRCLKRRLVDIIFAILKNNKPYQLPENYKNKLKLAA